MPNITDAMLLYERAVLDLMERDSEFSPLTPVRKDPDALLTYLRHIVANYRDLGFTPEVGAPDNIYRTFVIRKKNGKGRYIVVPNKSHRDSEKLRYTHLLINRVVSMHNPHTSVGSYVPGVSLTRCSKMHENKRVLVGIDFADYFYSIRRDVVQMLIETLLRLTNVWIERDKNLQGVMHPCVESVSGKPISVIAQMIAELVTVKSPVSEGYVLPIGIIPAPAISNLVLFPLDEQLTVLTAKNGIRYSRYCDNVFLSSNDRIESEFIESLITMIENYDVFGKFIRVNREKTRIIPYYKRQRMLGVVVNKHTNLPKEKHKKMRSAMNHLFYDLIEAKKDERVLDRDYRKVIGNLSFTKIVNPRLYKKYEVAKLALQVARIAYKNNENGGAE